MKSQSAVSKIFAKAEMQAQAKQLEPRIFKFRICVSKLSVYLSLVIVKLFAMPACFPTCRLACFLRVSSTGNRILAAAGIEPLRPAGGRVKSRASNPAFHRRRGSAAPLGVPGRSISTRFMRVATHRWVVRLVNSRLLLPAPSMLADPDSPRPRRFDFAVHHTMIVSMVDGVVC